ncbi:MAG: hypothetical protein HKN26_13795, partial [Acidimicrobiales bacterium]|nr:hypothetical protein [Acidimicrobiales bacterium]
MAAGGDVADFVPINVEHNMLRPESAYPPMPPDAPFHPNGMPKPELRAELRRIPNARNAVAVVSAVAQVVAVFAAVIVLGGRSWSWVVWVGAFFWMGRLNVNLFILGHEAAHRLLFTKRFWNDVIGRWVLSYPLFNNFDGYRRVHFAHHKDEMGPREPDNALYVGYPIKPDSFRRKLTRDAIGRTGVRLMKQFLAGVARPKARAVVIKSLAINAALFALLWWLGGPWLYPVLWLGPYFTIWRVLNRLRSLAEHGGMTRSDDRRKATHHIEQSWVPRAIFVPYN